MRRVEYGVETTTQHQSCVRPRRIVAKVSRLLVAALLLAAPHFLVATPTKAAPLVAATLLDGNPDVNVSPTSLDFGVQTLGTASATQTVTFTNLGPGDVTVTATGIVGDGRGSFTEADNCTGQTLSPNGSAICTIDVGFTPTGTGAVSASLVFNDNGDDPATGGNPQIVALSGTGASPTDTPTATPIETATDTAVTTPSPTSTDTTTNTATSTPIHTNTATNTPTEAPTSTSTATSTPTNTATSAAAPTATGTATAPPTTPPLPSASIPAASATLTRAPPTPVVNLSGCTLRLPLTVQAPSAAFTGATLRVVVRSAAQTSVRVTLRTALPQSVVLATAADTTNRSGVFTARIHIASGVAAPAMLVVAASNDCRSAGATTRVTLQARCVAAAARGGSLPLCMVAVGQRPLAAAVDVRRSHVFVVAGDGTVSVLDARSGMLVRAVAAGVSPWQIAVDSAAGRAFVVDQGASRRGHGAVSVLDTASGSVVRYHRGRNRPGGHRRG